jgi:catechol 2,3-dioxygenase-like lactoylglutathione lyase family enzyme
MLLVQNLKHMPKKFVTLILALFCTLGLRAQSADLSGIAHVAFRVNDLAKSRDFYNKLGFEQAFEFTDASRTSVAFIKVNDRQFIELYPRTADSQPGGLLHICFEASDIESVRGAYLKRELLPAEVKKARAGNLLFVMHDPEGQLLEYTQYLPDSLHSMDHAKHLGEHRISDHLLEATTWVKDIQAERAFYAAALSFESASPTGFEFFIAGNSGDKVGLQPQTATAQPRITFRVSIVRRTARDLRSRGFHVQKSRGAASIADPDGSILSFVSTHTPTH